MPWVVPQDDEASRRSRGDLPPRELPSVVELGRLPAPPHVMQENGVLSLGSLATPTYNPLEETHEGDFRSADVASGNAAEGVYYQTTGLVDVGSLQYQNKPADTYGNFQRPLSLGKSTFNPRDPQDVSKVLVTPSAYSDSEMVQSVATTTTDPVSGEAAVVVMTVTPDEEDEDELVDLSAGNEGNYGNEGAAGNAGG